MGEPGLHLVGPYARGFLQGSPREPGVSRETSDDRPITRRSDSRLVTGSPGLKAPPRLKPRLPEIPGGEGDHTRVPVHT